MTRELIGSILLLGGITYLYRYSFISARGRAWAEKIPPEFLKLLAPATFASIIANNLMTQQSNPEGLQVKVVVASLSLVIAYFSKSIMLTLSFGLVVLYILQNYV